MAPNDKEPRPGSDLVDLLAAVRRGSERSINQFVRRCGPDLQRYVQRRGAEVPEALANQVMAEFLLSLNRLRFETSQQIWGYLYQIARSRLIDERRRTRVDQRPLNEGDYDNPHLESFEEQLTERMAVADLLGALTNEQQEVLRLRFIEDLSIEETARHVGKSVSAVKGLQYRAIATLIAL